MSPVMEQIQEKKTLEHLPTENREYIGFVEIGVLPLNVIIESDDEGFIARTIDLPLYGYSEDPIEALENLKHEVESLYDDLLEDDNLVL